MMIIMIQKNTVVDAYYYTLLWQDAVKKLIKPAYYVHLHYLLGTHFDTMEYGICDCVKLLMNWLKLYYEFN